MTKKFIYILFLFLLTLMLLLLGRFFFNGKQITSQAKTEIQIEEYDFEKNQYILINNNSLVAVSNPVYCKYQTLGILMREDEYIDLLAQYDWDLNIAQAIMQAESSKNPKNENPNDYHRGGNCWGSYGLMQIGCVHFGKYGYNWNNRFDPETNIRVAYELYKESGWKPWSVFNDNSYTKFLW